MNTNEIAIIRKQNDILTKQLLLAEAVVRDIEKRHKVWKIVWNDFVQAPWYKRVWMAVQPIVSAPLMTGHD